MRQRFGELLLDLFFPHRCLGCGRTGTCLCPACYQALPRFSGPLCPHCAVPLDDTLHCRRRHPFQALEQLYAAAPFEGNVREAIHALKYEHIRALQMPLGKLLFDAYTRAGLTVDVAVPVPLHSARLRERGFNQSALLATELGSLAGLAVDTTCLQRIRATASQTELRAAERVQNVQGAFGCDDRRFAGQAVLLIDDVCTTGATIEAAANALKQAQATHVYGLVLARAVD